MKNHPVYSVDSLEKILKIPGFSEIDHKLIVQSAILATFRNKNYKEKNVAKITSNVVTKNSNEEIVATFFSDLDKLLKGGALAHLKDRIDQIRKEPKEIVLSDKIKLVRRCI